MSRWIRKGDKVVVLAGNEKGKTGKVRNRLEDRVIVEGLNIRKRHLKPKSKVSSGIVEMETPIHVSKVRLCDDKDNPIKVKVKISSDGKKQLVYFKNGKEHLYRDAKKSVE
ncbi:MAG: 50S ribosomal protein L24 [Chlamydiae bacterium]|nr:50S ribosomal protein L24 [Chlamydiota bacterium]